MNFNNIILISGITILIISFFLFAVLEKEKNFECEIKFCKETEVNETLLENLVIKNLESSCNNYVCNITFTILSLPYCNANTRNFKVEYTRKKSTLYVISVFSDWIATKCVCPVEIKGTIYNLPRGNYKLVYIFDNKYTKTKKVVDEMEFETGRNE